MWMIGARPAIGYSCTIANDGDATSARIRAELRGDGAGEKRLARAEVADEVDDGIGRERARDLAARGGGFGFVAAEIGLRHPRIVGWRYTPLQQVDAAVNVRNGGGGIIHVSAVSR